MRTCFRPVTGSSRSSGITRTRAWRLRRSCGSISSSPFTSSPSASRTFFTRYTPRSLQVSESQAAVRPAHSPSRTSSRKLHRTDPSREVPSRTSAMRQLCSPSGTNTYESTSSTLLKSKRMVFTSWVGPRTRADAGRTEALRAGFQRKRVFSVLGRSSGGSRGSRPARERSRPGDLREDSLHVPSHHLGHVLGTEPAIDELLGQRSIAGSILESSRRATDPVVVGADADVIDPGHL